MDTIRQLWNVLPHPPFTTVRWFAKSLDGKEKWGGYADEPEELKSAIDDSPGKNFYVCPNPSSSKVGIRHRTEDVQYWSWFLIDIDPVVKVGYAPRPLLDMTVLTLGEWLGRRIEPVVIYSGRGMQAWIRLNDPILTDVPLDGLPLQFDAYDMIPIERRVARLTMRYWLEKLNKRLGTVGGCKIDTTCSDLPRPMRCPGTVNMKTGQMSTIIEASTTIHRGLDALLITGVPPHQFRVDPVPSVPAGTEWQDVFVHLTIKAQNYLTRGKVEPGRHETMWHTARNLAEKGLTRDAVRRGLQWANERQGLDMALTLDDIEHALDTAFARLTLGLDGSTLEGHSHPSRGGSSC
jgi:hypothetical protein